MKKLLYFLILPVLIIGILTSCSDKNEDIKLNELLRTGEYFTVKQMETLKEQALSWQSARTGIGGFADIVVIEPSDNSAQQVFISVLWDNNFDKYEKMQIQSPAGAEARIYHASSGAGSGELMAAYKFVTEDSEWIELFYIWAGDLRDNTDEWETGGKWLNWTESQTEYIERLNELPPEERQFK